MLRGGAAGTRLEGVAEVEAETASAGTCTESAVFGRRRGHCLLAWAGIGFCRPSSVEGEAAEASKSAEQLVKNWVLSAT